MHRYISGMPPAAAEVVAPGVGGGVVARTGSAVAGTLERMYWEG